MLTTGMRIQEVTRFWFARRPWQGPSTEELAVEILQGVIARIRERGVPMPGVYDVIRLFRSRGLRLALASSSARIPHRHGGGTPANPGSLDAICSAENEARGKPSPDVYLTAAAKLGLAAGALPGR